MTLPASTRNTYAEVQHAIRYKKCLRHPEKMLVVQVDRATGNYIPWCVECYRERGDGRPVIGKADELSERMWDMATQQIIKRDQRIDALTVPTIKQLLPVGKANDTEIKAFILFCQGADANPFLHEAYLIKYDERAPASIVLALQWYLKRASHNPAYESYESGVVVRRGDAYLDLPGAAPHPNDVLFGGWCRVWKKGAAHPFERRVTMTEYDKKQAQWTKMPATMIEKVAIVQCIRRAFPDKFAAQEDASLPILLEGDIEEQPQDTPAAASSAPSELVAVVDTAEAPQKAPSADFEALVQGLTPLGGSMTNYRNNAVKLGYKTTAQREAIAGPDSQITDLDAAQYKLIEASPLRAKGQ